MILTALFRQPGEGGDMGWENKIHTEGSLGRRGSPGEGSATVAPAMVPSSGGERPSWGGNSAVTDALYLHNIGAKVTLVHRRGQLRAQEHLASQIPERQIPILWHKELRKIHRKAQVEEVVLDDLPANEIWTMAVEGIFIAIGYLPTVDLAQRIGVELTEEGYLQQDGRHRTNLAGIYSAGDAEGGFKQIVTAAGGGAEAALSIFEDLVSPYWKREGRPA